MRVVAFSCVHLSTSETQMDLQDHEYTYEAAWELMQRLLEDPPDAVVNLGDFTEPLYDGEENEEKIIDGLLSSYVTLTIVSQVYRLSGNHDALLGYPSTKVIDGVQYEHGHKLAATFGQATSRDGYTKLTREGVAGLGTPVVHGHTHSPYVYSPSMRAMDVGSVTFSQTYGEIIDGKMTLKSL